MLSSKEYTVGWICTSITEYVAAKAFLDDEYSPPTVSPIDNNNYTVGRIGKHKIVISCAPDSEYGQIEIAVAATDMRRSFPNITIGLSVGIAGGAPNSENNMRLGDVIVGASGVVQWDYGDFEEDDGIDQRGPLSRPPVYLQNAAGALEARYGVHGNTIYSDIGSVLERYLLMKQDFARPDLETDRLFKPDISHETYCGDGCFVHQGNLVERPDKSTWLDDPKLEDPVVHYGIIASGYSAMDFAATRDRLAEEKKFLCFDTTSAALIDNFPCVVIRGIANYADGHPTDEWKGYAAMTAAACAKDFLSLIPPTTVEPEINMRQVLDWLAPDNYTSKQNELSDERELGTCQWFLDAPEFQNWVEERGKVLFCPGMPGAGKTFMASAAVDHLQNKAIETSDDNVGVAYVYFDYRTPQDQKIRDLLACLLRQLGETMPRAADSIKKLYNAHTNGSLKKRLSSEALGQALREITACESQVFIVVDALDECQTANGCRERFFSAILELQSQYNVNVLVTSRAIPGVFENFNPRKSQIEIRATDEAIRAYLHRRIDKSGVRLLQAQRDLIVDEITKVTDGMFRFAKCYFDTISTQKTRRQLKNTLQDPKTRSTLLGAIYSESMNLVRLSDSVTEKTANNILMWLSCAPAGLTLTELQYALAVVVGESAFDEENIMHPDDIVSCCQGWITIFYSEDKHPGSSNPWFTYLPMRRYLRDTRASCFGNADVRMAMACLTVLLYDEFKSDAESEGDGEADGEREAEAEDETEAGAKEPQMVDFGPLFYHYAWRFWELHVKDADDPDLFDFVKRNGFVFWEDLPEGEIFAPAQPPKRVPTGSSDSSGSGFELLENTEDMKIEEDQA